MFNQEPLKVEDNRMVLYDPKKRQDVKSMQL